MNDKELSTIDFDGEKNDRERPFLRLAAETESSDLTEVLTKDLTSSGSFFIEDFKDTFFGKLLEALPIAGLLIINHLRLDSPINRGDVSRVIFNGWKEILFLRCS